MYRDVVQNDPDVNYCKITNSFKFLKNIQFVSELNYK